MREWFTHWVSAALVLAILLTALPFAELAPLRPSPRGWAGLHLSLGWALAGLTVFRLAAMMFARGGRRQRRRGWREGLKIALLATLLLVIASGTVIYRASPLKGGAYVFGFFEAGPLIGLSHSLHLQLLTFHRMATYALLALAAVHVALAFKRMSQSPALPIAWLWTPK